MTSTTAHRVRRTALTLAAAGLLLTAACGSAGDGGEASEDGGDSSYSPVTIDNCGAEVKFTAEPKRVVLLKSSPVAFLHDLDAMDRVVAKAGTYPSAYYDADTNKQLEEVPSLSDKLDAGGHLQISKETVIGQEPDLVLGEVENLSRSTLEAVGIPLIEEPALCEKGLDNPTFQSIYDQMDVYGKVFADPEDATAANEALKKRVAAVEAKVKADLPAGRTAAVLYPTVGGGVTYAYGNNSMADPQLKAAGFTNVFGDTDERVFEVSTEQLLGRNPDVLVLLYSEGDPAEVEEAVTNLPGAANLDAVKNKQIYTQLFNFTEPPTPLAVDGLEDIVDHFAKNQPSQ